MTSGYQETYETLLSRDGESFEEFYKIYQESIRASEKKTKEQIAEMVTRPDYKILLARRDGIIVGFSVLFVPSSKAFCLLEYMAVREEYRQKGIGKRLFRYSAQSVISERQDIPILLEVDSDDEASEDRLTRRKRKEFYRELGCLQVDGLSYRLPLVTQEAPPEMDLMVCVSSHSPSIRKHDLENWIRVVYHKVYGCADDDPRISRMFEPLPDPPILR